MLLLILVQKHCLSKKKRYIRYKMEKIRKINTRQYLRLVPHFNSKMAQMPPLFDENQQVDEPKLVDSLANKAPRSNKGMLVLQGFNPETGDLATSVKHCERSDTSDTKRHKKRSKFKEREKNSKKHHKKISSLYCSLHGENKRHTSRECNVLKKRDKDKDSPKYGKNYYRRKFKELNVLEKEASHQRAKYLKYKNRNKDFAEKKTPKEENIIIDDTLDSKSSSISEADNYPDKDEKNSIAYNSESADNEKSSNISIGSEENIWLNGCRYVFIINKLKLNIKSKIKEHTRSYNNLDKALHDAQLLNTMQNLTNKYKQTKSNRKLKRINLSPIIFVKLVIP